MQYRNIPNTDLEISEIGLGTWAMGNDFWGDVDDQQSIETIQAAIDAGVNFIDTAPAYGAGHAESVVGKAIKGRREKVIIATKMGVIRTEDSFIRDLSPKSILKEVDDSLSRLGIECIDLYQVHWPDGKTAMEDVAAATDKMKDAGKFRYLGVSNFDIELMDDIRQFTDIVSLQPHYSMLNRKIEKDIVPYCVDEQIGLVTYGTLAGGLLSGKYKELPKFEEGDNRSNFYKFFKPSLWPQIQGLLDIMRSLAEAKDCTVAQIAMRWTLSQRGIHSVLVGAKTPKQAESNAKVASVQLDDHEIEKINGYVESELSEIIYG